MTDHHSNHHAADGNERLIAGVRDRVASLLGHEERLCLGIAAFDLWAAFDQLVDPMSPPTPLQSVWIEDPVDVLRALHADLATGISTASTPGEALALGRAARCIASALSSLGSSS